LVSKTNFRSWRPEPRQRTLVLKQHHLFLAWLDDLET
jgi:hypothetical protein